MAEKQHIRAFIAITLPDALKEAIEQYQAQLKALAPKVKWVRPNAIHITLKFLGEQSPQSMDNVVPALMDVQSTGRSFEMHVKGFGAFPNRRRPRVLWLGSAGEPHEHLYQLHRHIEERLEPLGFEREKRRFSPHLTLGRIKFPVNLDDLWKYVESHPFTPYTFSVNEFVLMRSELRRDGARYTPIHKYPLQG